MVKEFGQFESGRIAVRADNDRVMVSLHWPFDRETDEWIDASADFDASSLRVDETGTSLQGGENADANSEITLRAVPSGSYRFSLQGRNTLGPVQADLLLPEQLGRELFGELASLAG